MKSNKQILKVKELLPKLVSNEIPPEKNNSQDRGTASKTQTAQLDG